MEAEAATFITGPRYQVTTEDHIGMKAAAGMEGPLEGWRNCGHGVIILPSSGYPHLGADSGVVPRPPPLRALPRPLRPLVARPRPWMKLALMCLSVAVVPMLPPWAPLLATRFNVVFVGAPMWGIPHQATANLGFCDAVSAAMGCVRNDPMKWKDELISGNLLDGFTSPTSESAMAAASCMPRLALGRRRHAALDQLTMTQPSSTAPSLTRVSTTLPARGVHSLLEPRDCLEPAARALPATVDNQYRTAAMPPPA